jgi:hypothetical protein
VTRKNKSFFELATGVPPPRVGNLTTSEGVRREMIAVYKACRSGTMNTSNGSKLIFMLAMINKTGDQANLENRLDLVETKVACLATEGDHTP